MPESMYDCYLSQFHCIKKTLANRNTILSGFSAYYRSVSPDRIHLVGSGTSCNACAAAAFFMKELLGLEVTVSAPTCMGKPYGERPLVIAVSQGGRSTNTIRIVKELCQQNIPVITLTDPKDTPVAKAGSFAIHLAADQELIGPKTRGYMVTVLTLYLMALDVAFESGRITSQVYADYIQSLEQMPIQGENWLSRCQEFYDDNLGNLKKARHYLFVGKGISAGVAQETALKVLETLCFPASGYEYEEFLHGPACCTDEQLALFFFLTNDQDQIRMLQTADIVSRASQNCYIVSHDPSVTGRKILYLPAAEPSYLSPFSDILFGQLLSARLTSEMGRTRHPAVKDIFQDMGTKVTEP